MFDEMRKGLQQIESIKQPDAGELRIGSSIVTDAGLLPAIIERFSQDFPRAVVHVLPENIAIQQYNNLRDRKGAGHGATSCDDERTRFGCAAAIR